MDAHLDILNDELCQVNTRVSRIARWHACLGGFIKSPSPSPKASEDEDNNGDSNNDDDDGDDDASSPSDDKMTAWVTYPLSLMTKIGSSFDIRVVVYIGGELL